MNAGAAVAAGDVLLFLHADTRLPADAAVAIVAALPPATGPPAGDASTSASTAARASCPLVAALMNLRSRLTGIATGDQGMFVTRALFDEAGGFPDAAADGGRRAVAAAEVDCGPAACLASRVVTSGRRWEARGPWRTIFLMWRLRFDYWRGVDPPLLARRYAPRRPRDDAALRRTAAPAASAGPARRRAVAPAPRAASGRRRPRPPQPAPILQVFLKSPVPGHVKTRLAAAIGDAPPRPLYVRLVDAGSTPRSPPARRGTVAAVELWCAGRRRRASAASAPAPPDAPGADALGRAQRRHAAAAAWRRPRGADARGDGDGARPRRARDSRGHRLSGDRRRRARRRRRGTRRARRRAGAGGRRRLRRDRPRPAARRLRRYPVEHVEVAAATRRRLAAAGARWSELPALRDIDDAEDLAWWRGAGAAQWRGARFRPARDPRGGDRPRRARMPRRTAPRDGRRPNRRREVLDAGAGRGAAAGWTALTFRGIERHTRYTLVADPEQRTVVRADARASASGMIRRLDIDAAATPLLRWRWKIARTIAGGDVTRKDGDDYAARIYVSFRYSPERLSLGNARSTPPRACSTASTRRTRRSTTSGTRARRSAPSCPIRTPTGCA